jgi:hypothetical protein
VSRKERIPIYNEIYNEDAAGGGQWLAGFADGC